MQYFIVYFSLLIPLKYNNANSSLDLMVCLEKLSLMLHLQKDLSATVCVCRHWCAQGQEFDGVASPEGQAINVTNGAQQPCQLFSAKAGLGAQPLASGQGWGARYVKACKFLRLSPLLCVQRKGWRWSNDVLELNAYAISASQKVKSVLERQPLMLGQGAMKHTRFTLCWGGFLLFPPIKAPKMMSFRNNSLWCQLERTVLSVVMIHKAIKKPK